MTLAVHFHTYALLAVTWIGFFYWNWIVFDSVKNRAYIDTTIAGLFVVTYGALLAFYYLGADGTAIAFRVFLTILIALPIVKNFIRRHQAKKIASGLLPIVNEPREK